MNRKLSVQDVQVKGKRVFVRVDFNVPLNPDATIKSDTRIKASLPTITHLIKKGGRLILASHLGRPKGEVKEDMRLRPVAKRLAELLGKEVKMAPDCVGLEVEKMANELRDGDVMLLENLRFHKQEEKNDPQFSKQLAALADVYVNDAFGTAHRAHASTEGITHHLKPCAAGFLIDKELKYLGESLDNPKRPLVAIIGGAKVSTKIGVIRNLLKKVDTLVLGGGMTYTFAKAQGYEIGTSLFEAETFDTAKQLLQEFKGAKAKVLMAEDCLVADKFDAAAQTKIVDINKIPAGWQGVDIGPRTTAKILEAIKGAGTVVWNGPVGVFEIEPFSKGTRAVAQAIAASQAISVLGGGETATAVKEYKLTDKMTHVSTGGGASLEFLEGIELPGIKALDDAT
ncbi:MAG: phosphoglycerate kinase [bacterium]